MRKEITTTLAVLALVAAVAVGTPASAKIIDFAKSGYWHAYGGINSEGIPLCGMSTSFYKSEADKAAGRFAKAIHIKFSQTGPGLIVQIFKDTWRIPQGTKLDVEFGFDNEKWGGVDQTDGDTMDGPSYKMGVVMFHLTDKGQIARFLEAFASADKMWMKFPTGNEAPWTMEMLGSREISKQFQWCISRLRPNTQPFSNPPTSRTQPFDRQKLPTPTQDRGT